MSELICNQALALRLQAGSEEAGYLSQIFPLPQTPTVVIIKNGDLKEYITPGASKEDFVRRIHTAFDAAPQAAAPSNQSQTTASTSTTHNQILQPAKQNLPTSAPDPY